MKREKCAGEILVNCGIDVSLQLIWGGGSEWVKQGEHGGRNEKERSANVS